MISDVAELPDDVETLKAMVVAARAETATLQAAKADAEARIDRLHALLKTLERARYGRRSEMLDPDQHEFTFEEIQTGLGAIEAKLDAVSKPSGPRAPRPRKKLPAHLERIEVVIEPEVSCGTCGSAERIKIGEDVSERLDVVPAKFRVIVTHRPRYACTACREGMAQAPAPAHLIEAGIPTEALLAHIAVAKYADGLPLYRQEAIFGRDRIELSRHLMAGWMGRIGFHLEPLADRVFEHIRAGERIFADETTLPTLEPGAGKAKIAWLWAYVRDDRSFGGTGPPMVAYRFEDSRGGDCPSHHLAGFAGLLQSDGYAAYKRLCRSTPRRRSHDLIGQLGAPAAVFLRAPYCRPVGHRHLDGRAHGRVMGRRAGGSRHLARYPPSGAAHDIGPNCRGTIRALGDGAQAHSAQIQIGRRNPIWHPTTRRFRALPSRWPPRHR